LTVFTEKGRVADDAVKGALHLSRQLDGLLKVIPNELLEHSEALVDFK
jgi:hypothetical protein